MKRLNRYGAVLAAAVVATLCGSTAWAQVDTGSILGTVRDPSGAVVPGATVSLTNQNLGLTVKTTTNAEGNFQFPGLRVGEYSLTVEATGFGTVTQQHLNLSIQQRLAVDFTLMPRSVLETVEVTGAAAQLQTQEASVGAVVQMQVINDLPLNGRNYTFLAQLNPGVTMGQQDSRGLRDSGTFSANGMYSDQNNYLLDGIDNNSNLSDFLNGSSYVYRPSVDALREFKVQTSNYSAEFGRSAGAVLNATLKSGTEKYHGSAYEFLRNSSLDAANFFENANNLGRGAFRRNQFGATLGGPVPFLQPGERKTFIFADYEGTRVRQAIPYVSTVPTALERSSGYTNLSDLITDQNGTRKDALGRVTAVGQVFDPATTRAVTAGQVDPVTGLVAASSGFVRDPFSGNMIQASRLGPNSIKLLNTFPEPNKPGLFNNYNSNPILKDQNDQGDVRVDQFLGSKDTIFFRLSYGTEPTLIPGPFKTIADGGPFNAGDQTNQTHGEALSWTHVVSASLVNEARVGYTHIATSRIPPFADQNGVPAQFGIQGIPQAKEYGGLPTFNITGLTELGTAAWIPTHETGDTFQLTDNVTKLTGNHSFKFGFEFKQPNITFWQPRNAIGNFVYTGTYTEVPNTTGGNTGLAQVLLTPIEAAVAGGIDKAGGPNQVIVSNMPNPTPQVTWQTYAGYIEDSWKVTNKLTVNLGLRYDFIKHGIVPGGYESNFLMYPSPRIVMTKGQCKKGLSASYLSLTAMDGIAITCAGDSALVGSPYTDLSPRVGIAYHFLSRWVLRSGIGRFYGTPTGGDILRAVTQNYPFSYDVTYNNLDPGHPIAYPNGTTATLESGMAPINVNDTTNFNARNLVMGGIPSPYNTPYSLQYNFTLQTQLTNSQSISLGYIGTQSRHLTTTVNYNAISEILPPGLNQAKYVPFPDFSLNSMAQRQTWGNSNYNGLQLSFERQFSGGLQMLANYTWSKCRTDARQGLINTIGSQRAPLLAGFGIHGDYALCDVDVTQIVHLSGTYDLPFGHGKMLMNSVPAAVDGLVGGWRMNALATLQSGTPFTIGCPITTTTGLGCFALLVPGQDVYAGPHNVDHWMNAAAFAQPPAATTIGQTDYSPLGGAPTQVRSPGFHRMDLSLFKEFPIHENARLEFRAECFNLTNTPQFGIPGFTGPGIQATPGVTDFTNTRNFGKITSTRDGANDQRELQFALKLYW
jgi:outer membrane receptor protein involved in Fe transport